MRHKPETFFGTNVTMQLANKEQVLIQRLCAVDPLDRVPYLIGMPMIGAAASAHNVHAVQESAQYGDFLSELDRVAVV
jgi:hypothetical protein